MEDVNDNRPSFKELFPTPYGKILVAKVYPVEGVYTIKDFDGRDIREENMPFNYMKQLKEVRAKIETWADNKMAEYNAKIAPEPTPEPDPDPVPETPEPTV